MGGPVGDEFYVRLTPLWQRLWVYLFVGIMCVGATGIVLTAALGWDAVGKLAFHFLLPAVMLLTAVICVAAGLYYLILWIARVISRSRS